MWVELCSDVTLGGGPGRERRVCTTIPAGMFRSLPRQRWAPFVFLEYGRKQTMAKATVRPSTAKKMTVGDLIRDLQAYPTDALALISSDEEGNQYKHLYNVIDGKFGEDEDDADDDRFEGHGLKVGDPYVIIWPHG
jgi:hypothetical protein